MIRESITAAEQFLSLLKQQIGSQPNVDELIEALQQLVDPFSEAELLGIADGLALFAEQLEHLSQIEEPAEQKVLLVDFHKALDDLIHNPVPGIWQYLLACLSDSHWPEALTAEDCEFLAELLEQDCLKLKACIGVTDAAEAVAVSPEIADEPWLSEINPLTTGWGEFLSGLADVDTETGVGLLHQLVEDAGEAEYSGFADLFALLAEQWESEADNPQRTALHQQAIGLLTAPRPASVESLLLLMSDQCWQEPLPEDDRAFLQQLLLDDLLRMNLASQSVADENSLSRSEPVSPPEFEIEPPALTAQQPTEPLPSFCQVELEQLQQPAPHLDPAVLTMLTGSLQQLEQLWQSTVGGDAVAIELLLNRSQKLIDPVIRAMQTVHLSGAADIVQGISVNLDWLQRYPAQLQPQMLLQISALLSDLINYLDDINDSSRQQVLLDQLEALELPASPTEEQISYIGGLLAMALLQSAQSIEQERANAADIQLSIADDMDPQLLDMLFNELPVLSEQLSEQLQRVSDSHSLDAIREAQRAAHTIKGLANMAGIVGIANLTHRLEDILELYTETGQSPAKPLCDDLTAITDTLAMMCEAVINQSASPDNALAMLQLLMDWHYRLRSQGLEQYEAECSDSLLQSSTALTQPSETYAALDEPTQEPAELPAQELPDNPSHEQTLFRVPQVTLDTLMRLAGEGTTLNTQLHEQITQLRSYVRLSRDRQRVLQRIMFELEQQLHEQFTLQPANDVGHSFDPLEMDRYNEMHTSMSRLQEAAADIQEVEQLMDRHIRRTGELHITQTGIQKETLERVLSTRLVEVKSITPRLHRVVRQACRSTAKQAELVIHGESVRVDSHILSQLTDPLMHIIRNAIDHGLETPEHRLAQGKTAQGQIVLRFSLDRDQVRVDCSDDGCGIDTDRIREVAIQRGLVDVDVQLTKQEAERLILIPGFSTREEISQLSGRGIGMDVVHQQIMRLQGVLDIRSETGKGTTFELSMPSSSLMIKTLLVRAGRAIYALANHGLEQTLISLDGRLLETADGMQFEYRGEQFRAYGLEALLGEHGTPYQAGEVHPVLLVNLGQGEKVAVMVREVIAHRELAFKQMGDYLPDLPGIPGLTILANGDTAAVIDLPARIRYKSASQQSLFNPQLLQSDLSLPKLLVVDDSVSARASLSNLLRDTGYDVSTAIDGLDAMNQMRKKRPDLVLTDLEMPRMGGMELTSMIRGREGMNDIPVLMITSRTTQRHREEAEQSGVSVFLTKPWTENALLDHVQTLLQTTHQTA
ncbi:response regulator [uncultured Amphritea sp.]|uniref:hybrid sensor histidine kinase/response regulator n=1 Tax=uncultured Amphritea sp. TaxID=981605 RepID=UPI0026220220|nr:response regulator [uncultured Amphritea sp.]